MTRTGTRSRKVSPQSSSRPAIRRPAYMPTPVPSMLTTNAVIMPMGAPSHQPTAPPTLAPRNVRILDIVYRGSGGSALRARRGTRRRASGRPITIDSKAIATKTVSVGTLTIARQIDDSRLLYPQRGPGYAASVDVAPKIETRVGENEARSLRTVRGQAEESHDGDKQQENGEQEIQRPHAGRYDLVHRLHDAYLLSRPVHSPHSPQPVRDLSHRRPRPHRIENRLHQRGRGTAPRRLQRLQGPLHASRLPRPALLHDASALRQRQRRILRPGHRRNVLLVRVLVHADHQALPRFDRPLGLV